MKSKFSATLFAVWISKISHVLSFYCIWKWWMVSLCDGTYNYWLSITYFILLCVFHFFLFFYFFLSFFISSFTCWGIEVSLEILKIKQSSWCELLELYLVTNVTGFVEPTKPGSVWEKTYFYLTSTCLLNYLLQSISVKWIGQFLFLIYVSLFFRCLEKVFREKRNKNEEVNSRGFTRS